MIRKIGALDSQSIIIDKMVEEISKSSRSDKEIQQAIEVNTFVICANKDAIEILQSLGFI